MRPSEPGAEAKVCELDVPPPVDEDVVGLDVTVDEAHGVNALHGKDKLRDVKPDKE